MDTESRRLQAAADYLEGISGTWTYFDATVRGVVEDLFNRKIWSFTAFAELVRAVDECEEDLVWYNDIHDRTVSELLP